MAEITGSRTKLEHRQVRWTDPVPEFNPERDFARNDDPFYFTFTQGFEDNFIIPEAQTEPTGNIHRHDFCEDSNINETVSLSLEEKRNLTTPLCHVRNILEEQYYQPEDRCGIEQFGKSVFFVLNCYKIVLPVWSIQVGDRFFIDTVVDKFQDKEMTEKQKRYFAGLIYPKDVLFFFAGPEDY